MKVFRGFSYNSPHDPCALAIGNFDGVHKGHMVLLVRLREAADRLHLPATVLTFNPHPRQYFALKTGTMAHAPATITPLREKIQALSRCHIDQVMIARFNNTTAGLSSEEFIEKILVKALNVKWLIIGENFRFGKGRTGTTDELKKAGERYGFHVEVLPAVKDENGRISSSCIRKALEESDFETVATLLGKPYAISGHVVHGDKIGRNLGFPTANVPIRHYNPILSGVFITRVHGLSENPLPSVSMIGVRPTIESNRHMMLETHILDFDRSCYGSLIQVEFLKKLRDNQKFPDLETLTATIQNDVNIARSYFAKHKTPVKN